jgi:hypothetical protein
LRGSRYLVALVANGASSLKPSESSTDRHRTDRIQLAANPPVEISHLPSAMHNIRKLPNGHLPANAQVQRAETQKRGARIEVADDRKIHSCEWRAALTVSKGDGEEPIVDETVEFA